MPIASLYKIDIRKIKIFIAAFFSGGKLVVLIMAVFHP